MYIMSVSFVFVCINQESFYSHGLKSLVSVSTVILLCLVIAYHAIQAQVHYFIYYIELYSPLSTVESKTKLKPYKETL